MKLTRIRKAPPKKEKKKDKEETARGLLVIKNLPDGQKILVRSGNEDKVVSKIEILPDGRMAIPISAKKKKTKDGKKRKKAEPHEIYLSSGRRGRIIERVGGTNIIRQKVRLDNGKQATLTGIAKGSQRFTVQMRETHPRKLSARLEKRLETIRRQIIKYYQKIDAGIRLTELEHDNWSQLLVEQNAIEQLSPSTLIRTQGVHLDDLNVRIPSEPKRRIVPKQEKNRQRRKSILQKQRIKKSNIDVGTRYKKLVKRLKRKGIRHPLKGS